MDRPPKTARSTTVLAPKPRFGLKNQRSPTKPHGDLDLGAAPPFLAQEPEDRQDRQPNNMAIFTILAILTGAPGPRLNGKNTPIPSTTLGYQIDPAPREYSGDILRISASNCVFRGHLTYLGLELSMASAELPRYSGDILLISASN